MAIEKMAINKEKEQEKLANDLFNEFSASKGVLFTQPGMFDKIKKEAYLDFVKTFDMQCSSAKDKKARIEENKNAFLSKLNKSAGNELGISNIKFIAEIAQKEKERQFTLTREERLREMSQRAKEAISKSGIFAVKGSEAGKAAEAVPEAPNVNVDTGKGIVAKPKEGKLEERKAAEVDFSTAFGEKAAPAATEKSVYEEGANELYSRYKNRFPKLTREDYYNYLKAFDIKNAAEFRKSLNSDSSRIQNIREMTEKELAKQQESKIIVEKAPEAAQRPADAKKIKEDAKIVAQQKKEAEKTEAKKVREEEKRKKEEAKIVAIKKKAEKNEEMQKQAPPVAIRETADLAKEVQGIFQTEQNILKDKEGKPVLNESGKAQYRAPSNVAVLASLGRIDPSALKEATGEDFIAELRKNNEAKGKTADEKDIENFKIVSKMIGAAVIYRAFGEKSGAVKKNQLKEYCDEYGYAEILGRVMSVASVRILKEQDQFVKDVISFTSSHIEKGKLDEIGGKGKSAGMDSYALSAIGSSYSQRLMAEMLGEIVASLEKEENKHIEELSAVNKQIDEMNAAKAAIPKKEAKAKKAAKIKAEAKAEQSTINELIYKQSKAEAELYSTTEMINEQNSLYGAKPKSMEELYQECKTEDKPRMSNLVSYMEKLKIKPWAKDPFMEALEADKAQMVLFQRAIDMANPGAKLSLAELKESGNVWKNYKILIMYKLKEIAAYKLSPGNRLIYSSLCNRYGDIIDQITSKLGAEEAAGFMIDLADISKKINVKDPSSGKMVPEGYEDYISRSLREKWTAVVESKTASGTSAKSSCLSDFKDEFKGKFNVDLTASGVSDSSIVSLVIDHRLDSRDIDFAISNSGMAAKETLEMLNGKLNDAKARFGEREYRVMWQTVEEAQSAIGFESVYKGEFRDHLLVRLALMDITSLATQKSPTLTLEGVREGELSGIKAFGAKITALKSKLDEVAPGEEIPQNATKEMRGIIQQRTQTQRANAYLELLNEFFPLKDERNFKITLQKLSDFKLRLDVVEQTIENMKGSDPYHIASDPELKKGCIWTLEQMKGRLDKMMTLVGKDGKDISDITDLGDRFLLDLIINGRIIIAGPHGFNYYDNIATVDRQGFIPIIFYYLNHENKLYLDNLLAMKEGKAIDTRQDAKYLANDLEAAVASIDAGNAEMRTGSWKQIMGSADKAEETHRVLSFQQAYDYYTGYLKRKGDSYDFSNTSALDSRIEYIFEKEMLDNINRSIAFGLNLYSDSKGGMLKEQRDMLATRLKIVFLSNLVNESPYYDLSNNAKVGAKDIPVVIIKEDGTRETKNVEFHENMMERWIDGYRKARQGIPLDRGKAEAFLGTISDCKWANGLKSGQYSMIFDNDGHGTRSFDVMVNNMGGTEKEAKVNITILEPKDVAPGTQTLQGLMSTPGGFKVYEGDRVILKSRKDESIALASKSNIGPLLVASANVSTSPAPADAKTGYTAAFNQLSLINNNLVPDGYLEEGTQPASFWTGMYFAATRKEGMAFISKRQMLLYDNIATFNPMREIRPEIVTRTETVLTTINLNLVNILNAPTSANIPYSYTDRNGIVHDWFAELTGANGVVNEHGMPSAWITNNATGKELTFGDLKAVMTNPNTVNIQQGSIQWNIITDLLYGTTNPPDNAKIDVQTSRNPNGTYSVYVIRKGDQNMGKVLIGMISSETVQRMMYGYVTDRIRLFIATETQLKFGKQIINIRAELGKPLSSFKSLKDFEDSRTMIYNLFLSSNILGLEFKKVLEESGNLITIQPYLIGYLEHLGPNDIRKIIETGGGVAGTFDMGMDKISLTPQLTGVTAGLGGNWNIVPRLSLYNNLRLSRHFSLYQSASVHYTFPATDILEKIKTQHFGGEWGGGAGLGFYYNMSTHWRMKLGGEYEYAPVGYETAPGGLPVQMFDVSGRIAYKSLSLEAQASYQLDKQYGPENLPYLGPGVAAGKIALVYNFGTLDFTPKHKATQKKVGK